MARPLRATYSINGGFGDVFCLPNKDQNSLSALAIYHSPKFKTVASLNFTKGYQRGW